MADVAQAAFSGGAPELLIETRVQPAVRALVVSPSGPAAAPSEYGKVHATRSFTVVLRAEARFSRRLIETGQYNL